MRKEELPLKNLNFVYPDDIEEIKSLLLEIKEQKSDVLQDYITKNDFLELFGIKEGMLYKLINAGKLQPFRINRKIYLKRSQIDEALQKGLLQ